MVANMARSFTRYLEFSWKGNEDIKQHWYLCEDIWIYCKTIDATKLIEFHTTLRERALRWFIKWSSLQQNPTIDEFWQEFIQELKLPQTNQ